MSKLKNIQALNQMLVGEHRTQTRKTHGFSDVDYQSEQSKIREVGEIWEQVDAEGKTVCWWEQMSGYKRRSNLHPDRSKENLAIREYLNSFPNCQKEVCTCKVPTRLDELFRKRNGMCEDCTMSYETKLKMQGKFNDYALGKMKANAASYFKEADKEVEVMKEELKNIHFAGDSTTLDPVERWNFENVDEMAEKIDEEYNKFKEVVMERFNPTNQNDVENDA